MAADSIFNAGGISIPNPDYSESTKRVQPRYITIADLDRPAKDDGSYMADISFNTASKGLQGTITTWKDATKYLKYGIVPNTIDTNLDKQLTDAQGTGEKFWNSLKQTVWSEIVLGTLNGFADLFDVITLAAFSSNNDYQNPVSRYLEEARENYRNNNPIYVDPNKTIATGGLTDAGWWLNNLPSVASSLTLLIPGTGVAKGVSLAGKGLQLNKAISWTRKAATGARKVKTVEEAERLGKVGKWINKESTITAANRMFENGLTATAMRTLENYQEARQTYNDMYNEASTALTNMSSEEYEAFKNKYADELEDVDIDDRDAVAKKIAHNSATKTFAIDYGNLLFDVVQVYALRNPLKLAKNMRSTAATRKAERLARRNAGKTAEQIAKEETERGIKGKVKDYLSDHVGALGVFGAESTESIEEAVNYIAQQEGMNYGRVMIDPENNPNTTLGSRLSSYLASPELYDAAFWGLMGGVVFQGFGSGFNRVTNAIGSKIKERKTKNKKTKEEVATNWRDRFETAENKRRVAEINARQHSFEKLANRLTQIEEGKDPFNVVPNDPSKQAELNSDEAIQIARERAIDEYIVPMTFRAIEAGNFNTLKAYLRDENVRKALADKGVIDSANGDTESLIQRMDEIEQIYNDNLIAIDGISQGLDVPFEYIQIIARDNALAQIQVQRLDDQLQSYETSAENNKRRFGANLDESIDYKSAVELAVTARRLSELRARKKRILEDKDFAKSLDGQNAIKDIDNEIKTINKNLNSNTWGNTDLASSFSDRLARTIWANVVSTQGRYDENDKLVQDKESDEYIGALNAIASRDMKALSNLTNTFFASTDEDIIALFGEEGTTGSYNTLSEDLATAFDLEKGIDKLAPNLNSDYQNIAAIKLAKLQQQSQIANTTETINTKINELHNTMNEARKKAITTSEQNIFDIAEKYGNIEVEGYIFGNEAIDNITEADKKKLDNAIEVLNLTADSNRVLGENLRSILFTFNLYNNSVEAVNDEENATNNQAVSSTENATLNNPITGTANEETGQTKAPQQPTSEPQQPVAQPSDKIAISPNIDGGIDATTNVGENDKYYNYIEDENGILILSLPKGETVPEDVLRTQYDGYDAELNRAKVPYNVISHPKLKYENGKYTVVERGRIEYNTETASSSEVAPQNPSTGEVVDQTAQSSSETDPKPVAEPIRKSAPESAAEAVVPVSPTDEYIENVENTIQGEANTLFKNRDKNADVSIVIDDIVQQLKDKHKSDENPAIVESAINRAAKILRARATRKGLIKSAAEVLSSSVTEMPSGKYDFSQAYKDAVVKMIDDYCREYGIREIGGKRYINLEEVFRRINTLFEDKHIADMMYGAMAAYLKTDDSTSRFVVIDDIDGEHFLENVHKSAAQRSTERIGDPTIRANRVSIDRLFENPSEEFLKTFDSLNRGDKLSIKVVLGEIKLTKNEVVVGSLPKPLIDSKTGAYYKYNNGWKTVVNKENGQVTSNLRDLFESILYDETEDFNTINDAITEFNYGKLTDSRKEELVSKIYDILKNKLGLVENGTISSSTSEEEIVGHLCKLWKYFNGKAESPDEQKARIANDLDKWFKKLYNEYDYINSLRENINDNNAEAVIENITSGEVIHVINIENVGTKNNYDKFTQSNSAFANPKEITLGIVDLKNQNILYTTTGRTIQHDKLGSQGSPTVIIPNKNGTDNYIIGTSVKFNDNNLTGDAKQIFNAIRKELNYLVDKHIKEGNYKALYDFLRELCYTTTPKGQLTGLGTNTGLLRGVVIYKTKESDNFFNISIGRSDRTGATLSIHNSKDRTFNFKRNGEVNFLDENRNRSLKNEDDAKLFKELLNEIINATSINIAKTYIDSDARGRTVSGFGIRTVDGKFNIYIPNSENPDQAFNKTYDSFQDAVISGGLIRVNTRVENGSNHRRKGENQANNQIMEVSIVSKTTSPVETSGSLPVNTDSNVERILKDDSIEDKANAILSNVMTEQQLKSLNDLHLLPNNIIFDENFNKKNENDNYDGLNARAILNKGITVVGKRWVQMFNEEGEFAGYEPGSQRKQAIRKLIHEQLHHILEQGKRRDEYLKKIEEIYNDFRDSLDNLDEDTRNRISKYLFSDDVAAGNKNIALEEFLVESLTSEELVDYLNSVQVEVNKKKLSNNLWQRIMKLLSDIFGWKIEKGSLREKELYALQGQLKNIRQALDTNAKTETEVEQTTETETIENETKETTDDTDDSDVDIDSLLNDMLDDNIKTRGSSITENPSYTPEMQAIKDKAIADGTFMKAPNGNPTNLNERQWVQVRTKNFINWFGDWINNPAEASKVVDENGEPLVVYHGSSNSFTTFLLSKSGEFTGLSKYTDEKTGETFLSDSDGTIFFSDSKSVGVSYGVLGAGEKFKETYYKVRYLYYNLKTKEKSGNPFKNRDECLEFIGTLSKYNPRFSKLKDYIIENRKNGKKLTDRERNEVISMLNPILKELELYSGHWNIVNATDYFDVLNTAKSIINTYNTNDGIERLLNGEIPKEVTKKWYSSKRFDTPTEGEGIYYDKLTNSYRYNDDYVMVSLYYDNSFNGEHPYLIYSPKEGLSIQRYGKITPISSYSKKELKELFEHLSDVLKSSIITYNSGKANKQFFSSTYLYPVFLNIKNPFVHDYEGTRMGSGYKNTKYSFGYIAARQVKRAKDNNNDGVIYKNIQDPYLANNYGVFNPNQIKSATSNTGEFSTTNDDIRYSSVTEAPVKHQSVSAFTERLPIDQQAKFMSSVARGYVSTACK